MSERYECNRCCYSTTSEEKWFAHNCQPTPAEVSEKWDGSPGGLARVMNNDISRLHGQISDLKAQLDQLDKRAQIDVGYRNQQIAYLTQKLTAMEAERDAAYDEGLLKGSEVGDATAEKFRRDYQTDAQRLNRERHEWNEQLKQLQAPNAKLLQEIGDLTQKLAAMEAEKDELRKKYDKHLIAHENVHSFLSKVEKARDKFRAALQKMLSEDNGGDKSWQELASEALREGGE